MPAYLEHKRPDMIISCFPSDNLRTLPFMKSVPFSNNSNIRIGLRIVLPHNKKFQDTDYEWRLYSRNTKKVVKQGNGVMKIAEVKASKFRIKRDKRDKSIEVYWTEKGISFSRWDAIVIGHLSEFETYELKLILKSELISSEEITITEFTLQDCDVFGMNYTNALVAGACGAFMGGLISAIILLVFGEF